jgi:hypothetical protein
MLEHCTAFLTTQVIPIYGSVASRHSAFGAPICEGVSRSLIVPLVHNLDPVYVPSSSLLSSVQPVFCDNKGEATPYFWYLAIKECLAAELCALNIAEYDGLPIAFYRDMAKQCFDETRHSHFFLETAIQWIREAAPESFPEALAPSIRRYLDTGTGLPIPREGNFFATIHAADVVERLILMNVKTETIAVRKLKERLLGRLCGSDPELKFATEIDLQDEISHVKIGSRWLRYLIPDETARSAKIEDTMLIRGVLMLNTVAAAASQPVGPLIDALLRTGVPGGATS